MIYFLLFLLFFCWSLGSIFSSLTYVASLVKLNLTNMICWFKHCPWFCPVCSLCIFFICSYYCYYYHYFVDSVFGVVFPSVQTDFQSIGIKPMCQMVSCVSFLRTAKKLSAYCRPIILPSICNENFFLLPDL